jgi:hypothetical protein
MHWIDEMFADLKKDRTAASAKKTAKKTKVEPAAPKPQIPGALEAWRELVSALTNDIEDFNNHAERAGQSSASLRDHVLSRTHFECEVHLPGMHSQRLVLNLDDKSLRVSVHPDFPTQHGTITMEPGKQVQDGFWILGETSAEKVKLSAQQLSEYLLKPVLSAASVN